MKAFKIFLVLLFTTGILFAGGSKDSPGTQQKTILRWGTVTTDNMISTKMMQRIIAEVNSKSKGLEIQGFPNGVLGSSRDMAEAIQNGMIDIISDGPGFFSGSVPLAGIFDSMYIYRDLDHMSKVINGPFIERLNGEFLKKNVRILGGLYYGTRHLSTTKTEVHSVKDVQGLRIRVTEFRPNVISVNSWGARPTPMPLADLYLSLATNVVDGQENPLATFDANKFYEVQKYIILTGHLVTSLFISMYEPSFKKLSPEDQQILLTAVKNGIAWNNQEMINAESQLQSELEKKGVTFIIPDKESFRTAAVPNLAAYFDETIGKGAWDSIQAVK